MSSAETAVGAGQASPDKAAAAPLFSKSYRVWMLFILLLINVMNLMDRQGMAAIGPAMKADLKLGHSELGFLQGMGFAWFHTLLGLPVALAPVGGTVLILAWLLAAADLLRKE